MAQTPKRLSPRGFDVEAANRIYQNGTLDAKQDVVGDLLSARVRGFEQHAATGRPQSVPDIDVVNDRIRFVQSETTEAGFRLKSPGHTMDRGKMAEQVLGISQSDDLSVDDELGK